ncbi:MAG: tRNA lysidine(34) synthetase TilS [Rikenellaceae bacterium]|nr:tRNA lysidine(34) synthetase TilS [Rikenellaceae bacterium]
MTQVPLIDRFQDYIREKGLIPAREKILLAVSGGVDSMVMLHLFVRCGYPIGVAHCNFGLRPVEADEDEVVVEKLCRELHVEHFNVRFDTQAEIDASGESVQMVARRLRYAWFNELCVKYGYDKTAIAHHADDSIETFFINLIRGTGLRGLSGISVTNGRVIRPLLFASRKEILDYAHANRVAYREDSSNSSTKYLRNKIRLGVIPRIREISPVFGAVMTANVERLSLVSQFLNRQIELLRREITTEEDNRTVINLERIDPELPRQYVVYEMLASFGFNADVTEKLNRCLDRDDCVGHRFYSATHVAYTDRRRIVVMPITPREEIEITIDEKARRETALGSSITFERLEREDLDTLQQPANIALLDIDRLRFPLLIRRWREGDTFIPFGMEGHKKVSDYLIDEKTALPDKERQLILESEGEIVWLVGRRIDDRYMVTPDTRYVLRITRLEIDSIII